MPKGTKMTGMVVDPDADREKMTGMVVDPDADREKRAGMVVDPDADGVPLEEPLVAEPL